MKYSMGYLTFSLALTLLAVPTAYAEVSVIVHPSNANAFDRGSITRLFLGKNRAFPNGDEAVPMALTGGNPQTNEFTENVLNKTPKQLKAYWAKMIFTGKGVPPKEVDNEQKVIDLVSKNPNLIGFVRSGSETSAVKVVGKF